MDRRGFLQAFAATALVPAASACHAAAAPEKRRPFPDLYTCEGCDGALERDPGTLSWSSRIGTGEDRGEPLLLAGMVYGSNGRSPAPNVVIYAHHTNSAGLYENGTPDTLWSRRHGRLRGWVRTGADGRFEFRTIKPAAYPTRDNPAHIHLMIKEAGRQPYWIDDVVFAEHFGVNADYRSSRENRGGSGIVSLDGDRRGWVARRDIILEVHPA